MVRTWEFETTYKPKNHGHKVHHEHKDTEKPCSVSISIKHNYVYVQQMYWNYRGLGIEGRKGDNRD